jgi:hypothetical protein
MLTRPVIYCCSGSGYEVRNYKERPGVQSTHSHKQTHLHKNRVSHTQRQTKSHSDTAKSHYVSLFITWFRPSQILHDLTGLDMRFIEIKVINCIDPQNCLINYLDPALLSRHGRVTQNIKLISLRLTMNEN